MPKYGVIIPSAGKGERFGGGEKKTLAKLDGRPVFLRTIELFLNREDVCQVILAVGMEDIAAIKSSYGANLGFMGVKLVEGGTRRCDSVAAALKQLSEQAAYVAVHDAVRPCASHEEINAVFAEAVKSGAAILATPITGTIKRVGESQVIESTESREGLYEAQTPQVFRRDIILSMYADPSKLSDDVTDDAQLAERAGHAVVVVASSPLNLKITTKADLALAGAILKSRPAKAVPKLGAFEEAKW